MVKKSQTGFTLTEVITTIAIVGCIVLLGIGMFTHVRMDNNLVQTKQARLDSAVKSAAQSIIGKEGALTASQACSATNWQTMLMNKLNAKNGGTVKVNGIDSKAVRISGIGTIAVQISSSCGASWDNVNITARRTNPPVALFAVPDDEATSMDVPTQVTPTFVATSDDPTATGVGITTIDEPSETETEDGTYESSISDYTDTEGNTYIAETPVTTFSVTSSSVSETYTSTGQATTVAVLPQKVTAASTAIGDNTTDVCWNTDNYTYTSACTDKDGNHINLPFYMKINESTCIPAYCKGNGELNGQLITSGMINNVCADEKGNAGQCGCPKGKSFWAAQYIISSDIQGICLHDCSELNMVESTIQPGNCVCPSGTEWDNDIKKCIDPESCPEPYLMWDGSQCVCDKSKVVLANDEIYSNDVSKACKEKCDTANYWFPNKDQTVCERKLPPCTDCLKELNMSTYECQCKANTTNTDMINCGVTDNKYFTGVGNCVAACDKDYKIRNPYQITSCICPATQPQGMILGQYEKYDPSNSVTCKTCDTVHTNRIYGTAAQEGNCVCMDSIAITFDTDEYYDTTQPNCKNVCPEGTIPDATHTYCYNPDPVCGCLEVLVNHKCVCNENITTAQLKQCADLKSGNIFDATAPQCQAPCNGTAVPAESLKACSCSCLKSYNGTTCVCDPNAVDQKCLNDDEKFDASQYNCKSCKEPNRQYDASGACVCKSATQIAYSGPNMKYDPTAATCESPCSGIGIRSINNPYECICPSVKPSSYVITPGYHYSAAAGIANGCMAPCPIGDYCPGTRPDSPNTPIIDPDDPNPVKDTLYTTGDVMKCPCGNYGAVTGLSKAACSGKCKAGYNCPIGSTSATQKKCTGNQLCREGICQIENCSIPTTPNTEHTACVCQQYKPSTFVITPGYHYSASAGVANNCIAPCPVGDYCPGTRPDSPDQPIVDPDDPNPIKDTTYITGDVMKCPCGNYGAVTGLSKAACSGKCKAGYNCPAGSTSSTQNKCTGTQLCKEGVCQIETCSSPSIPNTQHTACICPSTKPLEYMGVSKGYYYNPTAGVANKCQTICPEGNYCPGSYPEPDPVTPEQNPNYPDGVYKCPCGTYGATKGLYNSSCSGFCAAGYHCPSASVSEKQENCPANSICLEGVCEPELCETPSVPDSTRTVCVCAQTKPIGFVITPGKHYDANAGISASCLAKCPVGDYCPGTQPNNPEKLIVDKDDPNPIPDKLVYPAGDVLKCPCGTYGAITGLSKAACSGKCSAGYTCPAGSTKDKAQACAKDKICLYGVCEPQECPAPLIANKAQTECICPATQPVGMVIEAGYYYDSNAVATLCKSSCPTDIAKIQSWILSHSDKFTKTTTVYDATKVGCIGECSGNYIASVDKTACICGLSASSAPAGHYFDATSCTYKECPKGHYCPGQTPDPNPSPEQDPNYPTGVIKCPCGTYGSVTKLTTYTCSGKCKEGYRCPSGSVSDKAVACTAGQTCPQGTCTPGTCDFPSTSSSPYTSCNICRTEASIRETNPTYISSEEVYSGNLPTCKKCKSNKIYDASGMCVCPADQQLWYDDKCNKCQKWNKIYLLRQYSQYEPSCTLGQYMKGDKVCFEGGNNRAVGDDMKAAADKLSSKDKARTFNGVFAYMVAENGNTAEVVGTFTINSWYTTFYQNKNDYSYNAETYPMNIKTGTCEQVCTVNGSANADCVSTCKYLRDNIKTNTMTNTCVYAETNFPAYVGKSLGDPRDEYCKGGKIVMNNGCEYNIGGYLRRYSSPLILDLKGDGFKFTTLEDGVIFDLDNDGTPERISWSAPQTEFDNAFLVLDKNKNGQVDNGGELFGDQNGSANGFIELAKYDDNNDRIINKDDKIFNELLLWVDFNKNAKVDYDENGKTAELKTLSEAGVTELSLDYKVQKDEKGNILTDIYGNITGFIGSFKMMIEDAAGKLVEVVRTMIDVFFMSE